MHIIGSGVVGLIGPRRNEMAYGRWTLFVTAALAAALAGPAQAAPRGGAADQRVDVYTGELTAQQFRRPARRRRRPARRAGQAAARARARHGGGDDHRRAGSQLAGRASAAAQAGSRESAAQRAAAAAGDGVPPVQRRGQHPRGAAPGRRGPSRASRRPSTIGRSVQGKPITAVRVSKNVAHAQGPQAPGRRLPGRPARA